MSFSAIRMGAYEPIKYKLGGVDNAHTPMIIKVQAATIAGKPNLLLTGNVILLLNIDYNFTNTFFSMYMRDIVVIS